MPETNVEDMNFKALVVKEQNGVYISTVKTRAVSDLPENELLINVRYSSLNYKDALSATGNKGVTRQYPHTPGIDAVGVIVRSKNNAFAVGDEVIVTSYDLGMNTSGGFGQYISVPAAWAVKLPSGLSMRDAMAIGTAGLTAGMSVLRLTEVVKPEDGPVIVSGATGGVGIICLSILSKLSYKVTAISGKAEQHEFLIAQGAADVLSREAFEDVNPRPMLKAEYAGGIDTVGGDILVNIIKSTQPMGVVTCCGNVASLSLNLNVLPFILRGVSLIGIDSQNYPMTYRENVWQKLANEWTLDLSTFCDEVSLEGLQDKIPLMLKGQLTGRTIVKL